MLEIFLDKFFKHYHFLLNGCNRLLILRLIFSRRIVKSPVFPIFAGQIRAIHIATHSHNDVNWWKFGQELAVLPLLHVDAI